MPICSCNVTLSFQRCFYLLKKIRSWKWLCWHIFIGRIITRGRERSSFKHVKYFTTMTCLAGFLNAIAAWTKSLSEKAAKTPASTVHWKRWIEAWNPNPTFSRWGQKLFQSIFLLTKLEIEAFFAISKTWPRWNIEFLWTCGFYCWQKCPIIMKYQLT